MVAKCVDCGRENPDGSMFCDRCGKMLPPRKESLSDVPCPACGSPNPESAALCAGCGRDLGSRDMFLGGPERVAAFQWTKPTIAAILMVEAGVADLYSSFHAFTVQPPVTDLPIDVSGLLCLCGSFILVCALIVIFGAYFAYSRRRFTLAITGTAAGILGVGPLGLGSLLSFVALVLVALSADESRS